MSKPSSSCGPCGDGTPVQPGNQIVVPPGSHIVQQPCPVTPSQSAAVQPSPFGGGGGNSAPCANFELPQVSRSFVVPGTGQTGSFFASCASNWALSGMILFFPARGQLEVLGVSQDSVTYRNLTIDPNSEILEGVRFAAGIPLPPVEAPTSDGGGGPAPEQNYEAQSQLSNIRGVRNGVLGRLEPVDNHGIVGREGYWQRRPLGQMRYPLLGPQNILSFSGKVGSTRQWNVVLPSKPTLPAEVPNFAAELHVRAAVTSDSQTVNSGYQVVVNGKVPLRSLGFWRLSENACSYVITLGKNDSSILIQTHSIGQSNGDMGLFVNLLAYYY